MPDMSYRGDVFAKDHFYHVYNRGAGKDLRFFNVLFNAYVQAVNQQQNRKGTLFEGRFRHVWIDRDEYLIHLCRYIHQNPVKAGLATRPENWPYSNYLDWIGKRNGTLIDRSFVQEYFASADDYRQFVHDFQDEQVTQSAIKDFIWD